MLKLESRKEAAMEKTAPNACEIILVYCSAVLRCVKCSELGGRGEAIESNKKIEKQETLCPVRDAPLSKIGNLSVV